MKKMLGKKQTVEPEKPKLIKPAIPPYKEQWEQAGLTVVENDFGMLFKRVVRYPLAYKHGAYTLGQLQDALLLWENTEIKHPYRLSTSETLVFWDTETTGLKGVGTHIFLLGFLQQVENEFVLTQYVLADPANEAAMLYECKLWQNQDTLLSYNGKSFDWPQLETRWTLNRKHLPILKEQKHIDLLHSAKRLWKNDLEKMKLVQVEEEKLGFKRIGDIPGHLAPIIYFDAMKSGEAETLMKVLRHNEWDLLSLVTLYIYQTSLLLTGHSESAITSTNIGKWYGDLKERVASEYTLTTVTQKYKEHDARLAHFYLALEYKRTGRYVEAIQSFEKALPILTESQLLQAYEQLAIMHEHKVKDYRRALFYTEKALTIVTHNVKKQEKKIEKWQKRYNRLLRKSK